MRASCFDTRFWRFVAGVCGFTVWGGYGFQGCVASLSLVPLSM